MPERRTFLGAVFQDPWRKLFSIALAAALWTVLHRQIMDSAVIELSVRAVGADELPATEVVRRGLFFVVQTDEWRLVGWGAEEFESDRKTQLSIEAPNEVLAVFRDAPFGIAGPFDFSRGERAGQSEQTFSLALGSGPLVFGRPGTLRGAQLRIDGAEKIELRFRRYRREVLSLSPSALPLEGLDAQTTQIDAAKTRVAPERLAIRVPAGTALPAVKDLFAPIRVSGIGDTVRALERTALWDELDLHLEEETSSLPELSLSVSLRPDARLPEPQLLTFNPAKKVQGYFFALDAGLPIDPRDYVDFEPLQVDQALLRWKRPPTQEDLEELRDRAPELQRYVYFCADLSAMLDFDGPPPEPTPEGSTEVRIPFRIRLHDIRAPIEVRRRKDIPPGLAALLEGVEIEPAGASQVRCWRRP
ncbi:MAG: hypothetical protein IPN34_10155 [Planctomycetes bacterium]|nr:hypothetical protein [Planctomycetota bacterium]